MLSITTVSNNLYMQDPFVVSDNISISALSYTITYSDVSSDGIHICDSVTTMVSSCENGLCNHKFQVLTSSIVSCRNSAHIMITAFATNIFGNGSITVKDYSIVEFTNAELGSSTLYLQ